MKNIIIIVVTTLLLFGCQKSQNTFDASGVFEAKDYLISAESAGKILRFDVEEGDLFEALDTIGFINCDQFDLQKSQIEATIHSLSSKKGDAGPQVKVLEQQIKSQEAQIAVQEEQKQVFLKELQRIKSLVDAEAIPSKQLDDIQGKIDVLNKQLEVSKKQLRITQEQIIAQKAQVTLQNKAIMSEQNPLESKIAQVENQIETCNIINPIKGTVLTRYVNTFEMVVPGKALYKIADLETMILRAYITGDQLSTIKLNQEVQVFIDQGRNDYKRYSGQIIWISNEAEFTPKTIQTKDERANLVYPIKILVKNDGLIKIGMYGEVNLNVKE